MSFFTRRFGIALVGVSHPNLVIVAERRAEHSFAPGFDSKNVFAVRKNNPREGEGGLTAMLVEGLYD